MLNIDMPQEKDERFTPSSGACPWAQSKGDPMVEDSDFLAHRPGWKYSRTPQTGRSVVRISYFVTWW